LVYQLTLSLLTVVTTGVDLLVLQYKLIKQKNSIEIEFMSVADLEKNLEETFKTIKSREINSALENLREELEKQYELSSTPTSSYSLALDKYNEIKKILSYDSKYTKSVIEFAATELKRAEKLVSEFEISEEKFPDFSRHKIALRNLLLCNSWIYIAFWCLLKASENRNILSKLKVYKESVKLVISAIEYYQSYISLQQWEDIHQVGLFLEKSLEVEKKSKNTIKLRRDLRFLTTFVLWESLKEINIQSSFQKDQNITSSRLKPASGQSLLNHAGTWVGNDLKECLQKVHDTRSTF